MKNAPRIIFDFESKDGRSRFQLEYEIFQNEFTQRWLGLLQKTLSQPFTIDGDGVFFGGAIDDEEEVIRGLKESVATFNEYCEAKGYVEDLIHMVPHKGMSQAFLSMLHEIFENRRIQQRFLEDVAGKTVSDALSNLNHCIHRAEGFVDGRSRTGCHIEVLPHPVTLMRFHESDYHYFTPDSEFGSLNVTYGITGVPTLNGYFAKSHFRPQDRYSAGMSLSFYPTYTFHDREGLEQWLQKEYGLFPKDPHLAVGFIRVGKLVTDYRNKEELFEKIKHHRKIVSFTVKDPGATSFDPHEKLEHHEEVRTIETLLEEQRERNVGAIPKPKWPADPELFYHLDLVPYLDLKIPFNAAELYEEALRWLPQAVVHRNYDQSSGEEGGKWKSIALQAIDGDPGKTRYHWDYGVKENPNYRLTEVGRQCPRTLELLSRITDISKCERVRFMYLEPGAKIHVHKDNNIDVSLAVNISLNMPTGCEFEAQLNKDGSRNPFTVNLPFSNTGSVMLFNNAKYHQVYNDSNDLRIHLIFHGPIRIHDPELLRLAQEQNGFRSRRELVKRLLEKKLFLQEPIAEGSSLYYDWMNLGFQKDSLSERVGLIVVDNEGKRPALDKRARENFTEASLFPLPYTISKLDGVVNAAKALFEAGKTHVALIGAGTFVHDLSRFMIELSRCVIQMDHEGIPMAGHIMDHIDKGELPYFHEQFLVLDLRKWKQCDWLPLGPLFSTEEVQFPAYASSPEKFHDNYTPFWLKQANDKAPLAGKAAWGTRLMARCLEQGWEIRNLPSALRETKKYSYHLENKGPQFQEIEDAIQESLRLAKREIYPFNNEPIPILNLPFFKPTQLVSVAAGYKWAGIIDQYWRERTPAKVDFVDFSGNALVYVKHAIRCETMEHLELFAEQVIGQANSQAHSLFASQVLPSFDNSTERLLAAIKKAKSASYHMGDFVGNPEELLRFIDPREKAVLWISNAFYNRTLYFFLSRAEAQKKFVELLSGIAQKLETRCWQHKSFYTAVFGPSLQEVRCLITDGCFADQGIYEPDWQELKLL